jgi:hypothetical protein
MTPRAGSQLKANDNRVECVSRKFMLAGAWISALIAFSVGHILNNIEHVHLLKATLAFKELVATNICRRADAEPSTPSLHARPVGSTQNTDNTDFTTPHTCTG